MRTQPLPVEADDLLLVGDDTALENGRAVGMRVDAVDADPGASQLLAQPAALGVVADDAADLDRRAETPQVVRDIGGSAEALRLLRDLDDRHRGLGGNAPHRAGIVAIDHEIADHEDAGPRKSSDAGAEHCARFPGSIRGAGEPGSCASRTGPRRPGDSLLEDHHGNVVGDRIGDKASSSNRDRLPPA